MRVQSAGTIFNCGQRRHGAAGRHGGANSKFARFIAGGCYHAALIGLSANDERDIAVLGVIKDMDIDVKRVHV